MDDVRHALAHMHGPEEDEDLAVSASSLLLRETEVAPRGGALPSRRKSVSESRDDASSLDLADDASAFISDERISESEACLLARRPAVARDC